MLRKHICLLLAVLFCLGAAVGCAKEVRKDETVPEGVGLAQLRKDVSESGYWQTYDAGIVSVAETDRQTDPKNKTDLVFVKVIGENSEYRIEACYLLTYVLHSGEWLLEDLVPDPAVETVMEPKHPAISPEPEPFVLPVETPVPEPTQAPTPVPEPFALPTEEFAPEPTPAPTPEPEGEAPAFDAYHAQLQEYVDNGSEMVAITVIIPSQSTVTIFLPHQPDYAFENTGDAELTRKIKIPVEVFYPNTPLDTTILTITPEITITGADGSAYRVECPSFTREMPKLSIRITSPQPDEDGMIMAPVSNAVSINGTVSDQGADVTVNGAVIQVYEGGMFFYDFRFEEGVCEDDVETLHIVAERNNCVTDEKEISIHAYKFIPEPMVLEVSSEGAALRTDKNGNLTVRGKTLPGAQLTATSDNAAVVCGPVTVDTNGNFSFPVTADENFFGMSNVRIDAVKEGLEDSSIRCRVIKGFADLDAYKTYYIKTKKNYKEVRKDFTIADLLNNQSLYATNEYGIRITATVIEVITNEGDMVVKMTISKTNETVYVHNLSDKWSPADNIGGKYNVYCNFTGTYEDTGCAEFYGWFARIVK